ncbi:putative MFS family arabinose efflux permease [Tamaricihabitans halophyticus]|uniref:Putative proline/betaine transporter n=1 Tax=Tamaricihabitans halophyticus TaxID=1262583 RepID=A0A4R2QF70_9PSEU|nr:MFS transporter [Tamaricihabitans halophyticus]TCP47319.1 putative MFS family arabinose efflux permease [Tamaricihabitans halophyticus]
MTHSDQSLRKARKAGIAAFVGTTIEWYDFYIYATAASLVFGTVFFPETGDRLTGIAAAFATYAVGFFARPLGGIVFGHVGDRVGRKTALVVTLLMMGAATFLIGFLPTYAQVGVWAPILLVLLRFIQGLAVGGEWGGAVLMAVEHAPEHKKTFYGSFAQAGNPAGALLATGFFSLLSMGGTDFLTEWGWRIPFIASALLIVVGLVVRLTVEESPVFQEEPETPDKHSEVPILHALRTNWKTILLGIGVLPVAVGGYYLVTTFATAYATDPSVGVSESLVLNALSIAAFVELATTFAAAWLGDRVGRVRVIVLGLAGVAVLAAPQFLVFATKDAALIILAFIVMRLAMTSIYGPIATFLSQMFRPQARYTSISLSYQLAGAIFGGLSPLVSTLLFQATGSIWPVIALLVGMCVLSAACVLVAPQHAVDEPDHGKQPTRTD